MWENMKMTYFAGLGIDPVRDNAQKLDQPNQVSTSITSLLGSSTTPCSAHAAAAERSFTWHQKGPNGPSLGVGVEPSSSQGFVPEPNPCLVSGADP